MPPSLAQRITRAPHLIDADAAHARVTAWLEDIADTEAGQLLAKLRADLPIVGTLIAALAEGAPYPWDLIRLDPARLAAQLQADPDNGFDETLNAARRGRSRLPRTTPRRCGCCAA